LFRGLLNPGRQSLGLPVYGLGYAAKLAHPPTTNKECKWKPKHVANIIDYCADADNANELASWGAELSMLFRNGTATALEACNYFIDALNETVDDVAWYSLDRNYNLTVTRPTGDE
jgi:hypothetical protein